MIGRPSRDWINLEICELIASRSTCRRMQVGCVITFHRRIVSTGYNGTITPGKDCFDYGCDLTTKCIHAAHAEANAIAAAARAGIKLEGCSLYCTYSPCYECAKLIYQAGIIEVIYKQEYRDPAGKNFLVDNHIQMCQSA